MNNINDYRDHAEWDDEQEEKAKEKVSVQLENPVPEEEQGAVSFCSICLYKTNVLFPQNNIIPNLQNTGISFIRRTKIGSLRIVTG